jgi:hypothetical protein
MFMSNEAHFELWDHVNKPNSRYWGTQNPRLIQERPLHWCRVTVWCAISAAGVIGPYFFEVAKIKTPYWLVQNV